MFVTVMTLSFYSDQFRSPYDSKHVLFAKPLLLEGVKKLHTG